MKAEEVWEEFNELPPAARQQVVEFIAFLHYRYRSRDQDRASGLKEISREKFIGMWRNRQDMEMSSDWVRSIRKQEWVRGND